MDYDIKDIGDMHPEKGRVHQYYVNRSPIANTHTHHTKLIHTLRSST